MSTLLTYIQSLKIDWHYVAVKIFQAAEITVIVVGWLGSSLLLQQHESYDVLINQIGHLFGSAAILLYSLTLLPGILRRLQILPKYTYPLATGLTLFRRRFGVLVFLLMFIHLLFLFILPKVVMRDFSNWSQDLLSGPIWGLIALILLLPLWITSNDLSEELLGVWKYRIHRTTYLILIFIFLHAVYVNSIWAIPLFFLGMALVFSWIKQWRLSPAK